jgi:hypothetical protein
MKCIFYYDVQNIKILEPATSLFQKEEGTNDADLLRKKCRTWIENSVFEISSEEIFIFCLIFNIVLFHDF